MQMPHLLRHNLTLAQPGCQSSFDDVEVACSRCPVDEVQNLLTLNSTMKTTTVILLFLVIFGMTATLCAGRIGGQGERCLCRGKIQKRVRFQNINMIEPFSPTASCSKTEILISLKSGRRVCLDPNAKQGKKILKGKIRMKPKSQGGGKKQKMNLQ
ncbi:hypothetical protein MHYP_G00257070 [Metynnis hypsauchen]